MDYSKDYNDLPTDFFDNGAFSDFSNLDIETKKKIIETSIEEANNDQSILSI